MLTLPIETQHVNPQGEVHGGALFTRADTGRGVARYPTLAPGVACATIEIKALGPDAAAAEPSP